MQKVLLVVCDDCLKGSSEHYNDGCAVCRTIRNPKLPLITAKKDKVDSYLKFLAEMKNKKGDIEPKDFAKGDL